MHNLEPTPHRSVSPVEEVIALPASYRHSSSRSPRLPFRVRPMTEEDGAHICSWTYEPPYQLYGFLPWEQMKALEVEFGDARIRSEQYVSVTDADGELFGFAQFFPLLGVTRLGLGMRPDRLGQGYGVPFVQAIVEEARRRHPVDMIDLEVLTWNERAIRTYRRAGFRITDTYTRQTPSGPGEFYCMVYHP